MASHVRLKVFLTVVDIQAGPVSCFMIVGIFGFVVMKG